MWKSKRVLHKQNFVVPNNKNNQSFILDDENIDTTTIKVSVQRSVSDSTGIIDVWSNASTAVDVKSDTKAYFVEETLMDFPQFFLGTTILVKSYLPVIL